MRKFLALALFCAASLSGAAVRADEPGWPPAAPEPCKPCWIEPWLCKNPPCPPAPPRAEPQAQPSDAPDSPKPWPQPTCCREQPVHPL
jgi:hypothetical protein